jgi:hypothetical protein
MSDLCIPIKDFGDQQIAEIEIRVGNKLTKINFRVESFKWDDNGSPHEKRIENLKRDIENYNKNWELIQIYNPRPGSKYIQAMFRERLVN